MKRFCLILPLLLLLGGCNATAPASLEQAEAQALRTVGADYRLADADFIATNFPDMPPLKQAKVYLAANGDGREFGFFELSEERQAPQAIASLRAYLANEEQAVRALAALYPAEELQVRLARFARVKIEQNGRLIGYDLTKS